MDYGIEQWINGPAGSSPFWDTLMTAAANRAEPAFVALVFRWVVVGCLRRRPQDRWGAIAGLLAAGGALLVNRGISQLWDRARPFVAHPTTVHLLVSHPKDASFPSDHAAAGFAIAAVLFALHRRLGVAALVVAAFMSYARVYVGDHYPSDVAAGLIVGVVVAILALTWLRPVPSLAARVADRVMMALHLLPAGE